MKVSLDNQELYSLSETQKLVIQNDINLDEFESDMRRRLHWALNHKYEQCLDRLKAEWMPKLKTRVAAVPTNDEAFAQLVFSQPEYKSKKQRDLADK